MELKVQKKRLDNLVPFIGQTLQWAKFKEKKVNGRNVLVLELFFSKEGYYQTMVLALDKDLTEGDYKEIVEKLCQ